MDTQSAIAPDLVEKFVQVAHTDLDKVKELFAQEAGLVNSVWDWGGGDWETALGAAAHMGRKDIANYLLENGARLDLFAAAMLGKLEIVKATLTEYPSAMNVPGPHGISLLDHAKAGGEEAQAVVEYLSSL